MPAIKIMRRWHISAGFNEIFLLWGLSQKRFEMVEDIDREISAEHK